MAKSKGKVDWNLLKAEYISGGTSYRKLADKYNVSFSMICKMARKEKWTDLRTKKVIKRDAKLAESIAEREVERANLLLDTTEMLLRKIANQVVQMEDDNAGDISAYSVALERCKRILDVKSAADIDEQRARIDKLRKEAQTEDQNKDIKIVIEGNLDEYAK